MKTKNLFIITAVLTIVLVAKHETYSYALEPYQIDLGLGAAESYEKTGDITAQDSSHESSNELSSDNQVRQATQDDHDKENKVSRDVTKASITTAEAIKRKYEQEGLKQNPYHCNDYAEAEAEFRSPKAVPIPLNVDITLRGMALTPYFAPPNKAFPLKGWMALKYFFYLNFVMPIMDKYGDLDVQKTIELFKLRETEDFKALEWTISFNTIEESGNSIPVIIGFKNVSESAVTVSCFDGDLSFFLLNSIMIKKTDDNRIVMLTEQGARDYYDILQLNYLNIRPVTTLEPGEIYKLADRNFNLIENYDLSEPGEYELTLYTRNYFKYAPVEKEEYEYPAKTTVRFAILPKSDETSPESK